MAIPGAFSGCSSEKYEHAINLPPGEISGTEFVSCVNCTRSPPSIGTFQRLGCPPMPGDHPANDTYTTHLLSGDAVGCTSSGPGVSGRGADPSAFTRHTRP